VSDKVIEPRIWEARWWHAWWNAGPRLGFASAAMLSMAILAHGIMGRATVAAPVVTPVAQVDQAVLDQRVAAAVTKAVAALDAEHAVRLAKTVQQVEKRYSALRQEDLMTFEASFNLYNQKQKARYLSQIREAGALADGGVQ
jgi:hypothetical protein